MGRESLKVFIKVTNRKVSEGGEALIQRAEKRSGTPGELIDLLKKCSSVFDEGFDAHIGSLEKHLGTRPPEILKAMVEIIEPRLGELLGKSEKNSVSAPGESDVSPEAAPETAAADAVPSSAEEDYAALLEQKSVDEMSEEERRQLEIAGDPAEVQADEAEGEDVGGTFLDDLMSSEPASGDPAPPPTSNDEDVDFEALLQQKSVDEMSEEEREALHLKEGRVPPPSEEASGAPEAQELSTAGGARTDDLDALLDEPSVPEADQPATSEDDLDALLGDSPSSPPSAVAEVDELDALLGDIESSRILPTTSVDDLDSLLDESFAPKVSPHVAGDELDALLFDDPPAENPFDTTGENQDAAPDEALPSMSDPEAPTDELDALLDEAEPKESFAVNVPVTHSNAEFEDALSQLVDDRDSVHDPMPGAEIDAEDALEVLIEENSSSLGGEAVDDADALDELIANNAETSMDLMDDLLNEHAEHSGGSVDDLLSESASSYNPESIEDLLAGEDEDEPSEFQTPDEDALAAMMGDDSEIDDADSRLGTAAVDAMLAEVEEEDDNGVTSMLDKLQDVDEASSGPDPSKNEDAEDEPESFTDLLSEATGRKITEDDFEDEDEGTMTLDELIQDAESVLKNKDSDTVEGERVIDERFRLERSGEVLFEGSDLDMLRAEFEKRLMSGQAVDLKMSRIITREVVRVETTVQELNYRINVEID